MSSSCRGPRISLKISLGPRRIKLCAIVCSLIPRPTSPLVVTLDPPPDRRAPITRGTAHLYMRYFIFEPSVVAYFALLICYIVRHHRARRAWLLVGLYGVDAHDGCTRAPHSQLDSLYRALARRPPDRPNELRRLVAYRCGAQPDAFGRYRYTLPTAPRVRARVRAARAGSGGNTHMRAACTVEFGNYHAALVPRRRRFQLHHLLLLERYRWFRLHHLLFSEGEKRRSESSR